MATNKMSKELKTSSNRLNSLIDRKEKKLNEIKKLEEEIKVIEADITNEQDVYNEILKNESMEKVSKAMFGDNHFTADQVESLMNLIETFGASITDIDLDSIKLKGNTDKKINDAKENIEQTTEEK